MRFKNLVLVLGLLCPITIHALDVITVRIYIGTCAATNATSIPTVSKKYGVTRSAIASSTADLDVLSVPLSEMSGILSHPTHPPSSSSAATLHIPSAIPTASASGTTNATAAAAGSGAPSTVSIDRSRFLLRYSEPAPPALQPLSRRQTSSIFSGYIEASGQVSANCHNSMAYSLSDSGMLSAGGGTVFSTAPGTVYQRFNASTTIQNIYAIWEISDVTMLWNNNYYPTLVWNNNLFSNKTATFCVIHGNVRVYFLFPPEQDCMAVSLVMLPLSSCKYRLPPTGVAPSASNATNFHPS